MKFMYVCVIYTDTKTRTETQTIIKLLPISSLLTFVNNSTRFVSVWTKKTHTEYEEAIFFSFIYANFNGMQQ